MKTRVGIAISHDAIRAVLVRGRDPLWAREAEREPGPPAPESIVTLMSDAPLRRRPRPSATVVVGPHASQLKRLTGLPPVENAETLSSLIRENVSAFFLRNGAELLTTGVRLAEPGVAWAAAIDAPYVECVRHACRTLRLRLAAIAPCAVVLPLAIRDERFQRRDGPVTLEIEVSNGDFASVRRVPTPPNGSVQPIQMVDELVSLEERAEGFADAYAAAIAPIGHALTLGRAGDVPWDRRRRMRHTLPPAIAASTAAAALLLSPLIPWSVARSAESRLRAIHAAEEWRLTTDVRSQLQRTTAVLSEIEGFASSRPNRTRLLADLARALPGGAAIQRFDAVDRRTRLIAVAVAADSVVARVRAMPDVESVAVVGGIARVQIGGRSLERVTLDIEHGNHDPRVSGAGAQP